MKAVVLSNESLKEELLNNGVSSGLDIVWITDMAAFHTHANADVFIDLLFEKTHSNTLNTFLPKLILINSVEYTLPQTNISFVRINGWPGFLHSDIVEAAALNNQLKIKAEEFFSFFHKKIQWLPDEVGFVTPRVISMVINEAFFSLEEGISTREEIDIAMKLGTNYPYGPFEWTEKIGIQKIASLLYKLSKNQSRYTLSSLLLPHKKD